MSGTPRYELPEIHFRTWDSFKLGFREHFSRSAHTAEARYVFRGQSDAQWRLQSKFDREMRNLRGDKPKLRGELLDEFRRQMNLANRSLPQPEGTAREQEVRQWALGQHYALPTPLLDWSASPYIAAFFACQGAVQRVNVSSQSEAAALLDRLAVFALRSDKAMIPVWKRIGVTLVDDKNPENQRIRPQLGMFSLLNDAVRDLDQAVGEYCAGRDRSTSDFILKFTLPYSAAFDALRDLDSMDLNPRRIYADLEGVSRAAALNFRLAKLDG